MASYTGPEPNLVFDAEASIILLGDRGVGKSTLGLIASVAFGRRLIDFDVFFRVRAGIRRNKSGDKNFPIDSLSRQGGLFEEMLLQHTKNRVIVCGLSNIQPPTQVLLKKFAETHPVIHIVSNLRNCEHEDAKSAYRVGRACSNFEYYNLVEDKMIGECHSPTYFDGSPFLALKKVEQEFLRFLRFVFHGNSRRLAVTEHDHFPVFLRTKYTYILPLSLAEIGSLQNLEAILQDGVDAVEIRINQPRNDTALASPTFEELATISQRLASVRRLFAGPIFYHTRWLNKEEQKIYHELLLHGLRLCPEYLTVDLCCDSEMIRNIVSSRRGTSIIGNYHNLSTRKDAWISSSQFASFVRAKEMGCQMVRMTRHAQSIDDNAFAQHFSELAKYSVADDFPLTAYNTGILGRNSCCLNQVFSSVTSSLIEEKEQDSPCLTLREAQSALFSSFCQNQLGFYIVGTDVSSSLSPPLYQAAFRHIGMPHTFKSKNLSSIEDLKQLTDVNFGGASIAQGLKISVLPHTRFISPHAKAIGAVNTLIPIRCEWDDTSHPPLQFWRDRNILGPVKGLYGENTDWIGIYRCIEKRLSPVNAVRPQTTGLVMGAGGMARAAIYALMQLEVPDIFICNRTASKAHVLANCFNNPDTSSPSPGTTKAHVALPPAETARVQVIGSLSDAWPSNYAMPTVIVCCVRARGETNEPQPIIQLPTDWLGNPNGGVVVESSYEPLLSSLMKQVLGKADKGWIAVDGLDLLPEQAAAQFELFTGRKSPRLQMAIAVLEHYRSKSDAEAEKIIRARLKTLYQILNSTQ